ncbi:MAG: ATP-binding protein [Amaricoccus sp.]|uniref:sensor histidine kinase n=1 Tax=Amaricoccus sp. TaxID=1872485 RepID=UPI0039E6C49B
MPDAENRGAQFSARFSRHVSVALAIGILLVAASLGAAWWIARSQDKTLRDTLGASVSASLQSFANAARTSALDYAVWDDAFDRMTAGDLDWIERNIGASIGLGTFQMAVVVRPGAPPLSFGPDGAGQPASAVIAPDLLATVSASLDGTPIDGRDVATVFARSDGAAWLFTVARVVPQTTALPAGSTDANLTRLVFGHRVDTTLLDDIGRFHVLQGLALSTVAPSAGQDGEPLPGVDGAPVAWLTWFPPEPGHAVLLAFLLPLGALVIALGLAAVVVIRELVRSARSLEAAVARARAADAAKTEFLSNVSHELRTPLGGIIGLAQLLQMHDLDAESREMVDLLLASAHAQLHMVNSLLDIARIETGTIHLASTPFDAARVLEETVRLATPDISRKGIALTLDIAPDARRPILGDSHAFRQIATNLLGNAAKFTDYGHIDVSLHGEPDGLALVIADTGIGIDPANHQRIFERFVQVDGSPTRRVGGAGLGLAITAALVELMGGTIRVESAVGQGATFTVTLPFAGDTSTEPGERRSAERRSPPSAAPRTFAAPA